MQTRNYKPMSDAILKNMQSNQLNYVDMICIHRDIFNLMKEYDGATANNIKEAKKKIITTTFEKKLGMTASDADKILTNLLPYNANDTSNTDIIRNLMQLAFDEEKNGDPAIHTQKLCGLFGNDVVGILGYLGKYLKHKVYSEQKIPIHDACLFQLPEAAEAIWSPKQWVRLIIKNLNSPEELQKIFTLLSSAQVIESEYKKVKGNLENLSQETPNALLNYNIPYKRQNENLKAAAEFHQKGINEDIFNEYLTLKPYDDDKLLPDVKLESGGFTLRKLPANDPRAAILGAYTGCCQSLGSEGEDCVRYGIEMPNAGFYIITNKKEQIVSQFFAWRVDGQVVIDSLESSDIIFNMTENRGKDKELVRRFSEELLHSNVGIKQVHIGTAGRTPRYFGVVPMTVDYSLCPPGFGDGYRDSTYVRTLAMTDDEFFRLMDIENRDEWWLEAAKKITSIAQLIQCILRCPPEHYRVFAEYFNDVKPLSFYNGEYNDRPKLQGERALGHALSVATPDQFKALCDLFMPKNINLILAADIFSFFESVREDLSDELLDNYLKVIIEHYKEATFTIYELMQMHSYYSLEAKNKIKSRILASVSELIFDYIKGGKEGIDFKTLDSFLSRFDENEKARVTKILTADILADDSRIVNNYHDFIMRIKMYGLKFDDDILTTLWNRVLSNPEKYILNAKNYALIFSSDRTLTPTESNTLFENMKPYFNSIIKTYADFEIVCKRLNDHQKSTLYDILKDTLNANDALHYFSLDDFISSYTKLKEEYRSQYLAEMSDVLRHKITKVSDYRKIHNCLDNRDKEYLFDSFKDRLNTSKSGLCKEYLDFTLLWNTMNKAQQEWFFNKIKYELIGNDSAFKSALSLIVFYEKINTTQREWIFENIKNNLLEGHHFLPISQLYQFYALLDREQRDIVMKQLLMVMSSLKENFILALGSKIVELFEVLSREDRHLLFTELLKYDLIDLSDNTLILTPSDLIEIINLLDKEIDKEDLTLYLQSFKIKINYPDFANRFNASQFLKIVDRFPNDERRLLLLNAKFKIVKEDWETALLYMPKVSIKLYQDFLDIFLGRVEFKAVLERIIQHLDQAETVYKQPYSNEEKIHMLKLVMQHPQVSLAKAAPEIHSGLTLFAAREKRMTSMQQAVQVEIDTLREQPEPRNII